MCDIGTALSVGAGIVEKQAEINENNRLSERNRASAIEATTMNQTLHNSNSQMKTFRLYKKPMNYI